MNDEDVYEEDDTASNPLSSDHLPVSGEIVPEDGDINPDINEDMIV